MTYPTSLDNFQNPSSNTKMDDIPHATQHSEANDAIEALEAKLGTGASVAASGKLLRGTGAGTSAWDKTAPTGDIVGTSDTQVLTNKTLTTPTIGDLSNSTHTHANAAGGGQLDWDTCFYDAVHDHSSNAEGGRLVTSAMPSGSIIQVQIVKATATQSTSSVTFVDYPGCSITMTVQAGSKIIIMLDSVFKHTVAGNFTYGQFVRDGVGITNANLPLTITSATSYSPLTGQAYVENETAGSHTYKFQHRVDGGTGEAYGSPMMTIFEVAG